MNGVNVQHPTPNVQRSTSGRLPLQSAIGNRQSAISSFTLVELLVVIVIIGILAGMGITAMQHIGRSQALNTGARQFANDINMARNYAIVNSTYLYLVVATKDTTNSADYAYTAYGFCAPVSTAVTNAVNSPSNVKYVEDIRYLPKGVVFSTDVSGFDTTAQISFPADGSVTNNAWVVTFTPNGQILPMSRRPTFKLFEGIVDGSPLAPRRTGVSTNTYLVEINPLLGKPIVSKFP